MIKVAVSFFLMNKVAVCYHVMGKIIIKNEQAFSRSNPPITETDF